MSKLQNALANQQKICEAAEKIMDYFDLEAPYSVHVEQMLEAQTQIIDLMDMAKTQAIDDGWVYTDGLPKFLHNVHLYLKLLKPFVELIGQCKEDGRE